MSTKPQQGILSVIEDFKLDELSASIADLEIAEEAVQVLPPDEWSSLEKLSEPLQKLSAVVVESRKVLSKPEQFNLEKPKIRNALIALKEQVVTVAMTIPKTHKLEVLDTALKKLNAILEKIDTNLEESKRSTTQNRVDIKVIEQLIIPISQLVEEVGFMKKQEKIEIKFIAENSESSFSKLKTSLGKYKESATDNIIEDMPDTMQANFEKIVPSLEDLLIEFVKINSSPHKMSMDQMKPLVRSVTALKNHLIAALQSSDAQQPQGQIFSKQFESLLGAITGIENYLSSRLISELNERIFLMKEPFYLTRKEIVALKKDLNIMQSPVHRAILTLTELDSPLEEIIKIMDSEDVKRTEDTLQSLKATSEILRAPFKKLTRYLTVINSVMSSVELTVLELPNLRDELMNLLEPITCADSGILTVPLDGIKSTALRVIAECNKERLDYKTLSRLSDSLDNLKNTIEMLRKSKTNPPADILIFEDMLEPVNLLKGNISVVKEIGDNTKDFDREFADKLDDVVNKMVTFALLIDDINKDPAILYTSRIYEDVWRSLSQLQHSSRTVVGTVSLNEKMEILSQAVTLYADQITKLVGRLEILMTERRYDIRFIEDVLSFTKEMASNLQLAGKPLANLIMVMNILSETLTDTEKEIKINKNEDMPEKIFNNLSLGGSFREFDALVKTITKVDQEGNTSWLYPLEILKQNVERNCNVLKSIPSFTTLVTALQILQEEISSIIADIQAEQVEETKEIEVEGEVVKDKTEEEATSTDMTKVEHSIVDGKEEVKVKVEEDKEHELKSEEKVDMEDKKLEGKSLEEGELKGKLKL